MHLVDAGPDAAVASALALVAAATVLAAVGVPESAAAGPVSPCCISLCSSVSFMASCRSQSKNLRNHVKRLFY